MIGLLSEIKEAFGIVFDYINILQLLAISFSVVYVFSPAKRKTWKGWLRIVGEIVIFFAVETFLNVLLLLVSKNVFRPLGGVNFPLSHLLSIGLYAVVFPRKHNLGSRIIIGCTLFITAIDIAELGIRSENYLQSFFPNAYLSWLCLIADAMIIAFAFLIRKYSINKFMEIPRISVGTVVISSSIATGYILVVIKRLLGYSMQNNTETTRLKGLLCLSLILIYFYSVILYLIIYEHSKEYAEKVTAEVENSLLKANANMMVVSDQAMEEVREIRHDIGNQYGIIKMLLQKKQYDEAVKYFDTMNIAFEDIVRFVDCGNSMLNSIINMEILKAQSFKTRVVSIVNVPKELPIDSNDLCRILVNLIDNSIEALVRGEDENNRIVDLNISFKNDYLYIYVQNSIGKEKQKRGVRELLKLNTSKEDYKSHGYGHKIVRRIVDKYRGEIHYAVEDNEFIVEVMLDLRPQKGV